MSPYEALSEWLKQDSPWATCKYFRGPWRDLESQRNERLVSIVEDDGQIEQVMQTYTYRVVVVGPTDWESRTGELKNLRDLMQRIITRLTVEGDTEACGVAQIDVIGGIMGPGYTDTGRPWYGISLQLLV